MNMRSVNPALQLRPEAFNGIDPGPARLGIFTGLVVHFDVAIARAVNILVAAKFIGVYRGSRQYLVKNERLHIGFTAAGDDPRNQFAAPLNHTDHSGLVALVTAALAGNRAADVGFINFNSLAKAAKRIVAIQRSHILADFVAHAPCRLVGHADLALDFLGSNPVARGAEQKDYIEPIAQRRPRPVHRSVSRWKDLMAAKVASVGAPIGYRVELRFASAFFAFMRQSVARFHKMFETGFLGRKTVLKLAESRGFYLCHAHYVADLSPWRKGINAKQVQGDEVYVLGIGGDQGRSLSFPQFAQNILGEKLKSLP